jgi:uncharacterized membrane protein YsdA (DUF1294 family)
MDILFYYFLILNGIAFILMGYDKHLANTQKQRVSELTLLSFVFFGGTIGSGLAMLFFRHKTSKTCYLLKFFGITLIQILITLLLILNNKILRFFFSFIFRLNIDVVNLEFIK